jgi:hypothetical protein
MSDIPDPKYDFPHTKNVNSRNVTHYYGVYVRRLFLVAGLIQLLSLPYLDSFISIPLFFSTLAILVIVFFAGLTNPKQRWVANLNLFTSIVGLVVFEYFAVTAYSNENTTMLFFLINQMLALIFFFSLYYSSKTIRGMYLH